MSHEAKAVLQAAELDPAKEADRRVSLAGHSLGVAGNLFFRLSIGAVGVDRMILKANNVSLDPLQGPDAPR